MDESSEYYKEEARHYLEEGYEKQTRGEIEEAISYYRKSLEFLPTVEAFSYLGWAYSCQGDFALAIEQCHEAIRLDPENGASYNDLGAYLIEQKKFEEAIPWLEKAVQAKRYDAPFYAHYNLGRVWETQGNWMRAMSAYSRAIALKPDYTLAQKAVERLQKMMN